MSIEALCGIALCCTAAAVILKGIHSEHAATVSAAGGIILLIAAVSAVAPIMSFITDITGSSAYSSYYAVLIKALGIAFLTNSAAEICRDCKENGTADKIELIGKLSIVTLSLPVIKIMLETAKELIS